MLLHSKITLKKIYSQGLKNIYSFWVFLDILLFLIYNKIIYLTLGLKNQVIDTWMFMSFHIVCFFIYIIVGLVKRGNVIYYLIILFFLN